MSAENIASSDATKPASGQKGGRWRRWLFVAALAVVVTIAAAIVILSLLRSGQTDEDQIRAVLSNFAAAIDTEDQPGMLQMMCQEEATGITDSEDYDPAAPRASVDPRQLEPPNISDVRVFGDVASAKVTRRSTNSTLYLRKENGHWKLCAPAANQIPAAKPS